MTDEDILRMAREAGLQWCPFTACFKVSDDNISAVNALQRFAAMVASAERKACIKACKAQKQLLGEDEAKIGGLGIAMCIDAISTRGNK